jgi:hexulose-6-phosphate isomerase
VLKVIVMSQHDFSSRRRFIQAVAAGATGAVAATLAGPGAAADAAEAPPDRSNAGRIFKSVKWGMVQIQGDVLEKFELQKELGLDGVELNSPAEMSMQEAVDASRKTGLPIHGAVDSVHWQERLSSPDEKTRANGLKGLEQAIRDVAFCGGSAVLLVPGKVTGPDETHDDVWKRSIVEIRKALPLAAKSGVRILIENVWNGFCEQPEQMRDYLDEIGSPWVGSYFDIGNCRKFGPSENWVRALGTRIVKLDVKDWGVKNGFCKIGDGDVNWPAVRQELTKIGFTGWCTAEVQGGGKEQLADVTARMNRVLAL